MFVELLTPIKRLSYSALQSFDYEQTRQRLFQKLGVCIKLYIYVFITMYVIIGSDNELSSHNDILNNNNVREQLIQM